LWQGAEIFGYGRARVDNCSCLLVGTDREEPKTSKMRASTPSNASGEGICLWVVEVRGGRFSVDVGVEVDRRRGILRIFPQSIKWGVLKALSDAR
jgi:hypothetical protein